VDRNRRVKPRRLLKSGIVSETSLVDLALREDLDVVSFARQHFRDELYLEIARQC
jgi:hypothetical protein